MRDRLVDGCSGVPLANVRRERFALAVAGGSTLADAYREAYPKSVRWKDANVRNAAYGLARKPEVSARVSELRDRAAGADCASKHDILVALSSAIAAAAADGVLAANARLVDIYCRMRGFYEPERVDARVGGLDPSDRDRKIASLIGGG